MQYIEVIFFNFGSHFEKSALWETNYHQQHIVYLIGKLIVQFHY